MQYSILVYYINLFYCITPNFVGIKLNYKTNVIQSTLFILVFKTLLKGSACRLFVCLNGKTTCVVRNDKKSKQKRIRIMFDYISKNG